MKIRLLRAELFHADGLTDGQIERQSDMMKLIVAFRNFANTLKNSQFLSRFQSTALAFLAVKYTRNTKQTAFVVVADACAVVIIGSRYQNVVFTRFPHVIVTRINRRDFNCSESDRDKNRDKNISAHRIYIPYSCLCREKYPKKSAVEYEVS